MDKEKLIRDLADFLHYKMVDPSYGKTMTRTRSGWKDEILLWDKNQGVLLTNENRFGPHLDNLTSLRDREELLKALPPSVAYCFSNNKLYDFRNSTVRGNDEFWDIYESNETDPNLAFCDILYQWIKNQSRLDRVRPAG